MTISEADRVFQGALALHRARRFDEALASYDAVIELKPDDVEALNNRGIVLREMQRFDEALASYDQAIAFKPDYARSFNSRGNVLQDLKRFEEALTSYERAIALKPDYAQAFNNCGLVLMELKRFAEALASYERAIALKPDYAEAFNNCGLVLVELKRFAEALASYEKATALKPDYAASFNARGVALRELKRFDEALASYEKAIALEPDYAEAFNNRGNVLQVLRRFDDALISFDQAIALKADYVHAFNNRALVLEEMGRFDDALATFGQAIALMPNDPMVKKNLGMLKLLIGRYDDGWADYEWRWKDKDFPSTPPPISAPVWQGEPVEGRSIVVYAEQGLGDIIQFARYLPVLRRRNADVTFAGPRSLFRLLRRLSPQISFADASKRGDSFDFQCALMSLPLRFGTRLSSIPAEIPYLRAEDKRAAKWRERLGRHGFRIGIAWQGTPGGNIDRGRSIPLRAFLPLARIDGVRLVSLQKGHGLDQLQDLPGDFRIETLGDEFDAGPDAFIDTAAVMANLDLVITSDTSIAHLAGALGRPVWIALKSVPDWRWLLNREDSPWYPTARLFRQESDGDWPSVFLRMERDFHSLVENAGRPAGGR